MKIDSDSIIQLLLSGQIIEFDIRPPDEILNNLECLSYRKTSDHDDYSPIEYDCKCITHFRELERIFVWATMNYSWWKEDDDEDDKDDLLPYDVFDINLQSSYNWDEIQLCIYPFENKVYIDPYCITDDAQKLLQRLPWFKQRILWIAFIKKQDSDCFISLLPREMISLIIEKCQTTTMQDDVCSYYIDVP
uniref:Uncharacterized protein n=1 Tax=Marseillevirus LCMAC102 TaxID=2506603 RepID=A0A481YTL0_9VIRU|nr:MAG: hypothetical protein LCMAC102_00250 [Marseillevirus LCMAC102]